MSLDGSFSAAVARQTDSSFYVALKKDISFLSSVGMQSDDLCEGIADAYETKNRNLYEGVEHAQIFLR